MIDAKGNKFDMPVTVGALAASPEIYASGLGVDVKDIGDVWVRCYGASHSARNCDSCTMSRNHNDRRRFDRPGGGLASLPVPISTPGFDLAPYLTATLVVTKDPETGVRNMGTYRGQLKARDRLGVRMASRLGGAGDINTG